MTATPELLRLFSLAGKVAIVTGAASGIGKATARLLVQAGADVVVADRDSDGARSVAREFGDQGFAVSFDLDDDTSILALFASAVKRFGAVDILVNNAGVYPKFPFDELSEPQWLAMQRTNTWGCFVALREAARLMRARGVGGRIINISSIGGERTAVHDQLAYNASKAALDSMTLSAALELAPFGILVNSILPGAVAPLDPKPRGAGHLPPRGPLMDPGRMLLGRPARAEEVAGPILMLAGAAGGYITGQRIVIDGGFSVS